MIRRRARTTAVLAVAVLAAAGSLPAGCTGGDGSAEPTTYTIGMLAPLGGPQPDRAQEAVQGAQLAIEIINDPHPNLPLPLAAGAGLRHGSSAALAVGDTQGNPDAAEQQVDRLVSERHPRGLVIVDDAGQVRAAGRRADALRTPLVDASPAEPAVGDLGLQRYFRVAPNDGMLIRAAFGLIGRERAGGRRVRRATMVTAGGGRGDTLLAAVREASTTAGVQLASLPYADQLSDLDPVVQGLGDPPPDVVFAAATDEAEAAAAEQLAERLLDRIPVIVVGPWADAAGGPGVPPQAAAPDGARPAPDSASPAPTPDGAAPDGASPAPDGASPAPDGASPAPDGVSPAPDGVSPAPAPDGAAPASAPAPVPGGAPRSAAGAFRVVAWPAEFPLRNPAAKAVAELYQRRFGAPITGTAAEALTATLALAVAVDTAERPDLDGIRAALCRVRLAASQTVMPWNGVRFGVAGQNELAAGVVEERVGDGFRIVYPAELSTVPVAWAPP